MTPYIPVGREPGRHARYRDETGKMILENNEDVFYDRNYPGKKGF